MCDRVLASGHIPSPGIGREARRWIGSHGFGLRRRPVAAHTCQDDDVVVIVVVI